MLSIIPDELRITDCCMEGLKQGASIAVDAHRDLQAGPHAFGRHPEIIEMGQYPSRCS